MRFGIQLPCSTINDDVLRIIRGKGFEGVELLIGEDEGGLSDLMFTTVKIKAQGLNILLHAPFLTINIASLNRAIRRKSINRILRLLEAAGLMGCSIITIHPGCAIPMPRLLPFLLRGFERSLIIGSLKEVARKAEEVGVDIGIENMPTLKLWDLDCYTPCDNPEDLISLISNVNSPRLKVTLDVGHAATTGGVSLFVEKLADYIVNVHLGYKHTPKYFERKDNSISYFKESLKSLRRAGYKGMLIIEVNDLNEAFKLKESIESLRRAESEVT
ncbi:MAG: sugar phosphate isomerase/epimerase family protein [Candidatus Nezhaarchaeales archaeon]